MRVCAVTDEPTSKEPCGNEECDLCYPIPRFKVSTERVQRLFHERKIKAATPEEALRIYLEGTAWPSSYDDRGGEIIEEHAPKVTVVPPHDEPLRSRMAYSNCYHNLAERVANASLPTLTSCDGCGDEGCCDPTCERCHGDQP